MLERVVNRVLLAQYPDSVVIATSTNEGDNEIEQLCRTKNWPCFRGSEEDVLRRFSQAAVDYAADVVVRITSDCPLIDPGIIDTVIDRFMSLYPDIDYVSNTLPTSYPRGLDVEVMTRDVLLKEQISCTIWREHVTQGMRKSMTYRKDNVSHEPNLNFMRWTVDTIEDLNFIRKVYQCLGEKTFYWNDVLSLLSEHPEWLIQDMQKEPV